MAGFGIGWKPNFEAIEAHEWSKSLFGTYAYRANRLTMWMLAESTTTPQSRVGTRCGRDGRPLSRVPHDWGLINWGSGCYLKPTAEAAEIDSH